MGGNEAAGKRRRRSTPVFGGSCPSFCRSRGGSTATRSSVQDALCYPPTGRAFTLCDFYGATKLSLNAVVVLLGFFGENSTGRQTFCRFSRDDAWGRLLLVSEGAAVGSHFAGGGVDAVGAVHVGFDGFVAAEASVGGAGGPADGFEGCAGG